MPSAIITKCSKSVKAQFVLFRMSYGIGYASQDNFYLPCQTRHGDMGYIRRVKGPVQYFQTVQSLMQVVICNKQMFSSKL